MGKLGEFTKEEADVISEAVEDMFKAIPKTKRPEYIGHLNEILLFIGSAKKAAPDTKGDSNAVHS